MASGRQNDYSKLLVAEQKGEYSCIVESDVPVNKSGQPLEFPEEAVNLLADLLIVWVRKESSIVLGDFYAENGLSYDLSIKFDEYCPKWKRARQYAKTTIGARRERGGLLGTLDSPIVRASLGNYDPEHREYLKLMKATMQMQSEDKSISISLTQFSDPDQS